jgi:hypothetical protein
MFEVENYGMLKAYMVFKHEFFIQTFIGALGKVVWKEEFFKL